jgi:hypothetical protein
MFEREREGHTLTLKRPARLVSSATRLDAEYRAARWAHHRLLDFEDQHQQVIDDVAEACAPGISQVGRILARLAKRDKWAQRATAGAWAPRPRPALTSTLRARLASLRAQRDADPRWKEALGWADEQVGTPKQVRRRRAKSPSKVKRRKGESDEAWEKRFALLTTDETDEHYAAKVAAAPRRTRREEYRSQFYQQRQCYWGTWNALVRSVDQARADVLRQRKQGVQSGWRRPRFGDPLSLSADAGGFRVVHRDGVWWTVELRIGTATGKGAEWVRIRAKCGNWHDVPDDADITNAKLTRRKDGQRWAYTLSLTVKGVVKNSHPMAKSGLVSFDWGHREHGHDRAREGIRAFVWTGDDGNTGEVLIPAECRRCLDKIDVLKARMDDAFNARKRAMGLRERNRHTYRRKLLRSGVRTEEESNWLKWETRYERQVERLRRRWQNLRKETYTQAVRSLRRRYAKFAFEDESNASLKRQQKDEQMSRRARANRDLSARYEFVSLCERYGAEIVPVSARNTTRECPSCGHLGENTAELVSVCLSCGTARDKDYGAARVILRRAEGALANRAAE